MPSFGGRLTPDEVRLIQAYVIARGHESSRARRPD
jgi:hypothetical protein